jgi:hypothetical protein
MFLNRLSCATMNQLYHPPYTRQLFHDFNAVLVFVSNNEINANFSFTSKDKVSYQEFKAMMRASHLIGTDDAHFSVRAFGAYYEPKELDRKPFDIISSLALVEIIELGGSDMSHLPCQSLNLVYDSTYGLTILGAEASVPDMLQSYVSIGLAGKDSALIPSKFRDGVVAERDSILTPAIRHPETLSCAVYPRVKSVFADNEGGSAKATYLAHIQAYLSSDNVPSRSIPKWNMWSFQSRHLSPFKVIASKI